MKERLGFVRVALGHETALAFVARLREDVEQLRKVLR